MIDATGTTPMSAPDWPLPPAGTGAPAPTGAPPLDAERAALADWAGRGAAVRAPSDWARLQGLAQAHDTAPAALRPALAQRWREVQATLAPRIDAALTQPAPADPSAAAPPPAQPLRAMLSERLGPRAVPAVPDWLAAPPPSGPPPDDAPPLPSPQGPSPRGSRGAARPGAPAPVRAAPPPPTVEPPPPLKGVQLFERSWGELQMRQRVHQARAQLPDTAGPLNSQGVLVRALDALQGLSPAYLRRLLRHADALRWLEQAQGADLLEARDVLGGPAPAKRRARKAAGTD